MSTKFLLDFAYNREQLTTTSSFGCGILIRFQEILFLHIIWCSTKDVGDDEDCLIQKL